MKCTIPEISWHNREPVLSVDIHPVETNFYRLATGGSDTLVLIWLLKILPNGSITVEILSEMTRHRKAVNVVKWSPTGVYLASGDDDANIILWQLKTDNVPSLDADEFKEKWITFKVLRGHREDIYDISWSADGSRLLSGSVDNTAIIWDVNKGQYKHIIQSHKSFVQGVAFDPRNDYFATLSSDRMCRIFDSKTFRIKAKIFKGILPMKAEHPFFEKEVKYFHDDTFKTFFRRLSFSPDGSLLAVPSGCFEIGEPKRSNFATYIFTLDRFNKPAAVFPAPQCSIVAKFSPILYQHRPDGPKPFVELPYRMVVAVATDSDVLLYDTQQKYPFAHMENLHYTRLTDLSWSNDGLLLCASSTDGFMTVVTFQEDEIGFKYVGEESEAEKSTLDLSGIEILPEEAVEEPEPKRPSFLEKWAKEASNKRKIEEEIKGTQVKKAKCDQPIVIDGSSGTVDKVEKVKRRIKPTLLVPVNKEDNTKVDIKVNDNNKIDLKNQTTFDTDKYVKNKGVRVTKMMNPENLEKMADLKEVLIEDARFSYFNETDQIATCSKTSHKQQGSNGKKVNDDLKPKSKQTPRKLLDSKVKTPNPKSANIKSSDTKQKSAEKKLNNDVKSEPKQTPQKPLNSKVKTPKIKSTDKKSNIRGKPKVNHPSSVVSLLNYFKPLTKAEKDAKIFDNCDEMIPVDESKDLDNEIKKGSTEKIKINTSSLFKSESKTVIDNAVDLVLTEDSFEVPDDFELRIDSDDDCVITDDIKNNTKSGIITDNLIKEANNQNIASKDDVAIGKQINEDEISKKSDEKMLTDDEVANRKISNAEVVTEKENKVGIVDKNVDALKAEAKQPRRIPLITLSSPKNKTKRTDM